MTVLGVSSQNGKACSYVKTGIVAQLAWMSIAGLHEGDILAIRISWVAFYWIRRAGDNFSVKMNFPNILWRSSRNIREYSERVAGPSSCDGEVTSFPWNRSPRWRAWRGKRDLTVTWLPRVTVRSQFSLETAHRGGELEGENGTWPLHDHLVQFPLHVAFPFGNALPDIPSIYTLSKPTNGDCVPTNGDDVLSSCLELFWHSLHCTNWVMTTAPCTENTSFRLRSSRPRVSRQRRPAAKNTHELNTEPLSTALICSTCSITIFSEISWNSIWNTFHIAERHREIG